MSGVLQSGDVTPGHLVVWVTDGVVADAGITFLNAQGMFAASYQGIDFTIPNNDWEIPILLPDGFTRYRVQNIALVGTGPTSLTSATVGMFTAGGGGGIAVVSGGTAVTVNNNLSDTVNNMQMFTIQSQNTRVLSDASLFFRVTTPQSSAGALGNVTVFYQPVP